MKAYYIILETTVILSKKKYNSWKEIQEEYDDYKTSLGPWTEEELLDYLQHDFSSAENIPFGVQRIKDYYKSDDFILREIDC